MKSQKGSKIPQVVQNNRKKRQGGECIWYKLVERQKSGE